MNATKLTRIALLITSIFVGGLMIYGGSKKFAPTPSPTQMIEKIEKDGIESVKNDPSLKIKNYIFGMKQTGYFWQLLGICEILFGVLILSQYARFAGAVMLVPITLHIFLFHVFLEPDDTAELLQTGFLFVGNLALILAEYSRWKSLLYFKPNLF